MPFQKGKAANPSGYNGQGWKRRTVLTQAVVREMMRPAIDPDGECTDYRRANAVARKLVDMAQEGNMQAMALVWERLEGKLDQRLSVDQTSRSVSLVLDPEQARRMALEVVNGNLLPDSGRGGDLVGESSLAALPDPATPGLSPEYPTPADS